MSYCVRLILCFILLAMLILTFGVGIRWIVEHIPSIFWNSVLIVLFCYLDMCRRRINHRIFIQWSWDSWINTKKHSKNFKIIF